MNTKKKRFALKKRLIKHFLALTLAGSLLLPGLVLIQPQKVEASIIVDMASGVVGKIRYTTTVAEIIVSLLTGSGASVTNTQWLNQLNNAYGVESTLATATGTDGTLGAMYEAGLFSVDSAGHFVDQGLGNAIRNVPEYSSLGVDQFLTTTNADLELGAWQAADAATNIGEAASAGITLGTIGQAVGAVSMGVHLGVLANKVINWVGDQMAVGQPVNYDISNISQYGKGNGVMAVYRRPTTGSGLTGHFNGVYPVNSVYIARVGNNLYYANPTSAYQTVHTLSQNTNGTWSSSNYNVSKNNYFSFNKWNEGQLYNLSGNYVTYASTTELANAVSRQGGVPSGAKPYSPDVIGSNGNQRPSNYSQPTNPESWPDLKPNENLTEDNTGIQPIPWDDYMDQVQVFNQNTTNNNTTIQQGDTYNNFVTNYITEVQTADQVETPDYNPVVPEQPQPEEKPENTTEEDIENESYMTTPGLQDVFPFCIPFDVASLFGSFGTIEREAPKITFPLVSQLFGIDEEIVLDLAMFDTVATILRTVELIGFALGLAFVTRYLIGG